MFSYLQIVVCDGFLVSSKVLVLPLRLTRLKRPSIRSLSLMAAAFHYFRPYDMFVIFPYNFGKIGFVKTLCHLPSHR